MIKVTVPAGAPRVINANDGRIFHLQTVYLHVVDREGKPAMYPEKTDVFLDTDKATGHPKVYAPGDYQLHPSSIYLDAKRRIAVAPRFYQVQR